MNQINTEEVFGKRTVGKTFVEGIDSSMNVDVPAVGVIASNNPCTMVELFVVLQGACEIWVISNTGWVLEVFFHLPSALAVGALLHPLMSVFSHPPRHCIPGVHDNSSTWWLLRNFKAKIESIL